MQSRIYLRKGTLNETMSEEAELERLEKSRRFKSTKEARREFIAKKCKRR